jgi:vancomycin resistance protein YoaR
MALSAMAILVAGFLATSLLVRARYAHQALPGVRVARLAVAGMDERQIESFLRAQMDYPSSGLILLRDGERIWAPRPAELGAVLDSAAMARAALNVGRQGGPLQRLAEQWRAWFVGVNIPAVIRFDGRAAARYLAQVAAEIDRPTREAVLRLEGSQVVMSQGQSGRRLNIPATVEKLVHPIGRMIDAQIELVIEETPPRVLEAGEAAQQARRILSAPLVLQTEGAGPWVFEPQHLASFLRIDLVQGPEGGKYRLQVDPQALATALQPLAAELDRPAQDARFIFNDDTKALELIAPAQQGRSLDIPATVSAVQEALAAGEHNVELRFQITEPRVHDDATAEALGIREPVVVVNSYFGGSDPARIHNIRTAAAAFHGLLVAPGETLSMAEVLGDISLDTGYAEALIIFGDRTIKGVGGGVCQVSTTLFRAAFFGGYPILERHPHAYRVGYYELGANSPGPGLDATVFVPLVDFKFTNDREAWLLMETYIVGNRLIWKFYSSDDGRQVEWSSRQSNPVEPPEPLYRENPDLEKGEIRQVDWEAEGLDVTVTRTVRRGGQVLYEDVFQTHYLPWRAIYEYGPGTELPEGAQRDDD